MNIITQQWFEKKNLLSYKTRVEKEKLPDLISYIINNLDSIKLSVIDDIIFSVEEEVDEPNISIINVELLIPVDRKFKSSSRYVFKPIFRLENAVLAKYCGHFSNLPDAHKEITEYLQCNKLQPITKIYHVLRNFHEDTGVIDMFVGINGNLA